MLQELRPGGRPKETLGTGVNVCFQCEDALALYREFKSRGIQTDRKSTRLNSSHRCISYAVFCLKKKKRNPWSRIGNDKAVAEIEHITRHVLKHACSQVREK